MNYLSLAFVAFVTIALLAYYALPKKWRGGVLLCASLIFYGMFDLRYLLFLLSVSLRSALLSLPVLFLFVPRLLQGAR